MGYNKKTIDWWTIFYGFIQRSERSVAGQLARSGVLARENTHYSPVRLPQQANNSISETRYLDGQSRYVSEYIQGRA